MGFYEEIKAKQEKLAKKQKGNIKYVVAVGGTRITGVKDLDSNIGFDDSLGTPFAPKHCVYDECPSPVYPYDHWSSLELKPSYKMGMCEKHYKDYKKRED